MKAKNLVKAFSEKLGLEKITHTIITFLARGKVSSVNTFQTLLFLIWLVEKP